MRKTFLSTVTAIVLLTSCSNDLSGFNGKERCADNKNNAEENIKSIEFIETGDSLRINDIIFNAKLNTCIYGYRAYQAYGNYYVNGIYDYFSNERLYSCVESEDLEESRTCWKDYYEQVETFKK